MLKFGLDTLAEELWHIRSIFMTPRLCRRLPRNVPKLYVNSVLLTRCSIFWIRTFIKRERVDYSPSDSIGVKSWLAKKKNQNRRIPANNIARIPSRMDGYKQRWMAFNVDNFWSAQDIKIAPSGNVNWNPLNMLAKCFSIIRNYVLQVFRNQKYTICHQNTLLEQILATSLAGILWWWFPS